MIEPVGLEDRTAEVLRVLEEQRATVLYVTGTCGVGKSMLGMRGQAGYENGAGYGLPKGRPARTVSTGRSHRVPRR